MRKHNNFANFLKKINLSINRLLENYLNKLNFKNLSKNFKNLSNIRRSNKAFLTFIAFIILFLSYLSIPYIYNKVEVEKELKNQLLDRFNTNFIFSKKFKYKFFPRPQFIIEDSSIMYNETKVSKIKKLTIYLSLDKFFSLNNIIIKDVILENASFNFNHQNYNFFMKLLDNNFSESNFKIKDSNIFYRNIDDEVLFINQIVDMRYYYDPNDLQNIVYSENEIFNIPYSYELVNDKNKNKIFSKINLNILKFQIENEFNYKGDIKKGLINFIYHKNKSKVNYELNKNFFVFSFFDKLINPNFIYDGKINFVPFYSNLKGNTDKINLSFLLNSNSLFTQLIKTEILNNKNLNITLIINSNTINQLQNFIDILINFKIKEGLIDIDDTKFRWSNYANFKILDSLIYVNESNLVLDGKLIIDVKNQNEIYKFLQTSKSLRPNLKNLEFDFRYNFDQQIMDLNNIRINNHINEKVNDVLKKIILRKDKLQNKIYIKNIMKAAIAAYVG